MDDYIKYSSTRGGDDSLSYEEVLLAGLARDGGLFMPETWPSFTINLVYHKRKGNLLCHYCGYKTHLERNCKKDGKCDFIFSGPGVERISEEVKKKFPNKIVEIFSSDTMNKKSSKDKLEKITNNEIEILFSLTFSRSILICQETFEVSM